MYPEIMLIPMREELTRAGLKETRTAAEVDAALAEPGTTMLVVNSVCGCAAGKMRPAVRLAMQHGTKPNRRQSPCSVRRAGPRGDGEGARILCGTSANFAGNCDSARQAKLVYLMQRSAIETSTAPAIARGTDAGIRRALRNDHGVDFGRRIRKRPPLRDGNLRRGGAFCVRRGDAEVEVFRFAPLLRPLIPRPTFADEGMQGYVEANHVTSTECFEQSLSEPLNCDPLEPGAGTGVGADMRHDLPGLVLLGESLAVRRLRAQIQRIAPYFTLPSSRRRSRML